MLKIFGFDAKKTKRAVRGVGAFVRDYREWRKCSDSSEFPLGAMYPCLEDRNTNAGDAGGQYFHQDLMVARRVYEANPRRHIDIGSRIDGFVAHVAVFRHIEVLDIRPLKTSALNVTFRQCDFTQSLPPELTGCTNSVSCLHALEHFGLGRYGDPVDPQGHKKAMTNLIDLLQSDGTLYVSVPIGRQRVEFNAHRIFDPKYLVALAGPALKLERFSYVGDSGDLFENRRIEDAGGGKDGLGIYEFRKTRH